jgi:hypothetical protein
MNSNFALSRACWWLPTRWPAGSAPVPGLSVTAIIGAAGLVAVLCLCPANDQTILPHNHPDLPVDHDHLAEHGPHHTHALIIYNLHRRWPKAA